MGEQYLRQVLNKYTHTIQTKAVRDAAVGPLVTIVRNWGGRYLNALEYSGSFSKGTSIKGGTDIDLFISLSPETPGSMAELYNGLFETLRIAGYNPRKQNVSVGVTAGGMQIDLVPARLQQAGGAYHSLYSNKTGNWKQTNVQLHGDAIRRSGRIDEIRIMKIWRNNLGLDFPSFYLELTVIEALKNTYGPLNDNIVAVLHDLKSLFLTRRITDPANTNNIISEDLTDIAKKAIAAKATAALAGQWENFVA